MTMTHKSHLLRSFITAALACTLALPAAGALHAAQPAQSEKLSADALANATYPLEGVPGGTVTLTDGKYEDTANRITVALTGPQTSGDLNGDGAPDAAVTLVANTGGSGVFSYLSAVLNKDGQANPVSTAFLGDRIRVQRMGIADGVITVRYLDRRFNQPMSARPTIPVVQRYALNGANLIATGPLASSSLNHTEYYVSLQDGAPSGKGFFTAGRYSDSAAGITAVLQPKPRANGDLNGDGSPDAAVIVASNTGGTGTFIFLQAVLNQLYQPKTVAAVLLGDRVPVTDLSIKDGQITATWLERKPDEPMSAKPTVETTATFVLQGDQLVAPGTPGTPDATSAPATTTVTTTAATTATVEAEPAPLTGVLTGTATYLQRIALPPNSVVTVELADVSRADAAATIIASQTIETQGAQVPIPYELTYDPATIDPRFTYAVAAKVTLDDQLTWISQDANFVLTRGNPVTGVDILMQQVGAAAAAAATTTATTTTSAGAGTLATVADVLTAEPRFSSLASAVQAAGLVTPLKQLPAVTVFAPTNEAFAALGESALKELQGNTGMLAGILNYHVVTPTLVASDVVKLTELQPLLQGFTIPVTVSGTQVMVKDATIIQADIMAGNGVIHAIDKVITPVETFGMADATETKNTLDFVCADDKSLTITFDNTARTATVTFDGQTRTLKQEPSGSGFRYADDTWVLAGKGNEVILTDAKTDATLAGECFVKGAAPSPSMELTGSYVSGVLPAADASGRVITLTLSADGAAALTTQFIGKGDPTVEQGAWAQVDGNAAVTLTDTGGATNTLTFEPQGDDLVLLDPVEAGYGTAGLTLTRVGAEAGAGAAPAEAEAAPPAASASAVLTGTVTYRQKIALPDNAIVQVTLADVSRADAAATVIASQTIETLGAQVPIPYELTYDPAAIDPKMTYAVSARITVDGKLAWINDTRHDVLTRDAPVTGVDIVVVPVSSAAAAPVRARTVRYTCDNGVKVTVKYGANSAEVTYGDKTEKLPQVESGSGIRYSNANWEWNSKGQEGFLTDRKSNTIVAANCRAR